MMKITYLIGAGASFPALPLAVDTTDGNDGLASRMMMLSQRMNEKPDKYCKNKDQLEYIGRVAKELNWLSLASREYGNVDTMAKFYYIKEMDIFIRLKKALGAFFVFEQLAESKIDKRYLTFLTTVLDRDINFPDKIKILSWNYDTQIEIACRYFREEYISTDMNDIDLHNPPLFSYYPPSGGIGSQPIKPYTLFHLNGTAGLFLKNKRVVDGFYNYNFETYQEAILKNQLQIEGNPTMFIRFAWESNHSDEEKVDIIKEMVKGTTILVVIGYSFPYFNREMDNLIMKYIMDSQSLEKIVFQNPSLDGEFLRGYYDLPTGLPVIHLKGVDQFHIPREFA